MHRRIGARVAAALLGLLWLALPLAPAAQAGALRVVVNGQTLDLPADQQPFLAGGRVMVPMRAIFTALGARVEWDGSSRTVAARRDVTTLWLRVGTSAAAVDGKPISLDQPPALVRDRVYVPLRFVSTALGAQVDWDGASRTVTVSLDPPAARRPAWLAAVDGRVPLVAGGIVVHLALDFGSRTVWYRYTDPTRQVRAPYDQIEQAIRSDAALVRRVARDGWRVTVAADSAGGRTWWRRDVLLTGLMPGPTGPLDSPAAVLDDMVRVPLPESGPFTGNSSWWAADHFVAWAHGAGVADGPFAPPALLKQVAQPAHAPERVWATVLAGWQEGGRTYFRVKVTVLDRAGRLRQAGLDTVEVTEAPGRGYAVAGYGSREWPSGQTLSPVRVWLRAGSDYSPPEEAILEAPAAEITEQGRPTGRYRIPVHALGAAVPVQVRGGEATLELPGASGMSPPPVVPVTDIQGIPFVEVEALVAALDGRSFARGDASGHHRFAAQWRPDLGQLVVEATFEPRVS